jgi:hypothetical protein
MELIKIAEKMERLINDLGALRYSLKIFAKQKAENIAEYEKNVAKTLICLKNGIEYELDGNKVCNPPTTIAEKIARGICWQDKLKAEESESMYKSLIINIETIKAQLNGYQTIIKYLDEN